MKRWKNAVGLVLCLILVLAAGNKYQITASATGLTNDSIKQKENEIKKAKEEKSRFRTD